VTDDTIANDYALSDPVSWDGGRAHANTMVLLLDLIRTQYGSTQTLLATHGMRRQWSEKLATQLLERRR